MDAAGLTAWQRRLRFSDREAAEKVGLSVTGFRQQRRGVRRVGRQTELLTEYAEMFAPAWLDIAECATKLARRTTPRR